MGKEKEPQPNPLEKTSDARRSIDPHEILLYNAMTLGLLMATREEIQKFEKPLPRRVVEEVFVDGPQIHGPLNKTDIQPNKWYQAQLDKSSRKVI